MTVQLPVSKSIANRLLVLQALNGLPLLDVSGDDIPDDVRLMHDALEAIHRGEAEVQLQNCGTAMRFLTAYCAQLDGNTVVLNGSDRMRKRPIVQLVDALIACGADIWYEGEFGFPPLRVRGKQLTAPLADSIQHPAITINTPDSSQFVSALLLIGIEAESDSASPYITMTRKMLEQWGKGVRTFEERDWSAAAFWYEYIAIHGGKLKLGGLSQSDLQGDQTVADIFLRFGVETRFEKDGVILEKTGKTSHWPLVMRFDKCPDLYPAIAITCRKLHVPLIALGTATQRLKESDRLQSVKEQKTYSDHRIAMALLAADLPCDDVACISKSYPTFYEQLCLLRQ